MVLIGHDFGKDEWICVVMSRAWSLEDVYWDLKAKFHDRSKFIFGLISMAVIYLYII